MGLITEYLKNSEEDEELYFKHLDNATKNGSESDFENKLIIFVKFQLKSKHGYQMKHLKSILSDLYDFTKICVMTTSTKEMEFKKCVFNV